MAKERSEEEERRRAALKHNRNVQRGSMSRKDMFAALVKLSEELEATKGELEQLSLAHDRTRKGMGYQGELVSAGERKTSVGEFRRREDETSRRGVPYEDYEGRGLERRSSDVTDVRPRTMSPSSLPARLPAAAMTEEEIAAQQTDFADEKPTTKAARKALRKHKKRDEEDE